MSVPCAPGHGSWPRARSRTRRSDPRSCAAGTAPAWPSPDGLTEAPMDDESHTAAYFWSPSPLQTPSSGWRTSCVAPRRTATWSSRSPTPRPDPWTYGGRVMRRKAETVNFVAGGRWDEAASAPTPSPWPPATAPVDGLQRRALRADRAQLGVLGGAGLRPVTGEQARSDRPLDHLGPHPPIGLATARVMARLIEGALPRRVRPERLRWPGRLGLLDADPARHRRDPARRPAAAAQPPADRDPGPAGPAPRGAVLEHLHALLYGDESVTLSTLKAEVSHLRALGGQLSSRPYRLTLPVRIDVDAVLRCCARATCGRGGGVRRRPAARHGLPGPDRVRPSTSPVAVCARRCSPTPTPTRCCATPSWRRTTPRWSRCAWPRWARQPTRPAAAQGQARRQPRLRGANLSPTWAA